LIQLFIPRNTDTIRVWAYPIDLASRALAIPQISAIYQSDSKPAIELKGVHLQYEQPGYLPDPRIAVALFDMLCELAELIEQPPNTPGAGKQLDEAISTGDLA
jgi:hypothetical protein